MEAILILCQKGGSVKSVDLAEYMGYSKASVSHAVKNLRTGGFLAVDKNGILCLSHTGQAILLPKYIIDSALLKMCHRRDSV